MENIFRVRQRILAVSKNPCTPKRAPHNPRADVVWVVQMSRLLVVLLASATCRAGVLPDGTTVRVDADERRRSQLINGTNRLDSAASDPSTFYFSYLEENGSRPINETPPWVHAFLVSPLQMPPAGPLRAHRVDMPEAGRVMPPNAFHWPDVVGTGLTQSAKIPTEESEGAAPDPFNWENGTPPWAQMPPHLVNIPEGSESLRMLRTGGVATPPHPDMTICDMLLKSKVSPQTPVWCLCLQCESSARPPGECGEPGPSGSPGRMGLTGFTGLRGILGHPGSKGQMGQQGEKGPPGGSGVTGTAGHRGEKGETGYRGQLGFPGLLGPRGENGICPAACQRVKNPPGLQGPPGSAGVRGIEGSRGTKGNKGVSGKAGDPGMRGQKGTLGEQGSCKCAKGAAGNKGAKGDSGDRGTAGPQGSKGSPGVPGPAGSIGPCTPAIKSAFFAHVNQSFPAPERPVPFPHVITNQQGHFDPLSGIYTAPVNGTFVFTFHLAVAQKWLDVALFLNSQPVVNSKRKYTFGHTVVLHCTAGDTVYLKVKDALSNGLYAAKDSSSTFSGYLLWPDACWVLFAPL